jgi:hypothetical protein
MKGRLLKGQLLIIIDEGIAKQKQKLFFFSPRVLFVVALIELIDWADTLIRRKLISLFSPPCIIIII